MKGRAGGGGESEKQRERKKTGIDRVLNRRLLRSFAYILYLILSIIVTFYLLEFILH